MGTRKTMHRLQMVFFTTEITATGRFSLNIDPVFEKKSGNEACSPDFYDFVVPLLLEFCNHKMLLIIY